jgi:hypothetical protein
MLDFRKGLLALAVAGLGIVGTASAQVNCTTTNNFGLPSGPPPGGSAATGTIGSGPLGIRAEGMTEQLQQLIIYGGGVSGLPGGTVNYAGNQIPPCSGTTNTSTVAVAVTANAPFTNILLTGTTTNATDAIGYINYSPPASGGPGNGETVITTAGTLTNSTTMTFTFAIPVGSWVNGIGIGNLRVNASTLPNASIVTLTASGSNGIIVSSAANNSGFTEKAVGTLSFRGFNNIAVCTTGSGSVNAVGALNLAEGFATAFTTAVDENTKETNSGAATLANNSAAGTAVGTTLAMTFNGLGSGVVYYLPSTVSYTAAGNKAPLTLQLVSAPGGSALTGTSAGTTATGSNTGTTSAAGLVAFTPTNGSFTAYYQVTSDDQTNIDQTLTVSNANNPSVAGANGGAPNIAPQTGTIACPAGSPGAGGSTCYSQITLFETVASSTAAVPGTTAPSVSLLLTGATTGYAQFSSAATPYTATAGASSTVTGSSTGILVGCNTTLLFPYIANVAGYDTGIAVANASTGTSVAANPISAQNGSCTFTFYGGGATANAAIVGTPITVPTGTTQSFLLSNASPGFVGYAVATCTFQGGHGFAFITDGFGGGGRGLSIGYLAVILQQTTNAGTAAPASPFSFPEISR